MSKERSYGNILAICAILLLATVIFDPPGVAWRIAVIAGAIGAVLASIAAFYDGVT